MEEGNVGKIVGKKLSEINAEGTVVQSKFKNVQDKSSLLTKWLIDERIKFVCWFLSIFVI